MKKKLLAVAVFAGVLSVSGAAFADLNVSVIFESPRYVATTLKTERPEPPEIQQGKRPEMPPKISRDMKDMKKPPEKPDGKRPPMSRDKRMPEPPEFNGKRPDLPKK